MIYSKDVKCYISGNVSSLQIDLIAFGMYDRENPSITAYPYIETVHN